MAEREHFTNGRSTALATGIALMATSFGAQIAGWQHFIALGMGYGIGTLLVILAAILITKSYYSRQPENSATEHAQASATMPGIPTLSALLGQNPSVEFDAKQFFAFAHYSPITAEIEKNMKIAAQKYPPNEREAFYARLIGVGVVAFQHEQSWLLIFGSQLRAMEEMNSRGIIPVADLRKHYEKAVASYPKTFENYSFDQWLAFMKERLLIAIYPSRMVELSWYGKDFLKYLAHTGRNLSARLN